jgi:hypothetical protein
VADNPFVEFHERYGNDWPLLVEEVFGKVPDEDQKEVLIAVQNGERRISIRSGHGRGKTTVLVWCIMCTMMTRVPFRIVATAPTSTQLFDVLAADTKALIQELPEKWRDVFDPKSESVTHKGNPAKCYLSFKTSRAETPEAMAGVHLDEGWVLIVGDEASGIPDAVFVAGHGSMSGKNCITILAGNPVRTSGFFYDTHHSLARGSRTDGSGWLTFHWSCYLPDGTLHPRITQDFVDEAEERYGLGTNDYRVRVLGEFPTADKDAYIGYQLIQDAISRDVTPMMVKPIWGLDCARKGGDRAALAKRQGNVLLEPVKWWKDLELMELVGRVKAEWDDTPADQRPQSICIDAIGLGAGVSDRLIELGLPAMAINVSETPALGDGLVLNLKTELWDKAASWFMERTCSLQGDKTTAAELGWPRKEFTSTGKRRVQDKDKVRKDHRGKSPDLADAFVMTFADQAGSAIYGSSSNTNWKEPLQRNVTYV